MILNNRHCPSCGNDLHGVLRLTLVSEKNQKKREIKLQKYLEKSEEKFKDWGKK
jgi:hypothetical protein